MGHSPSLREKYYSNVCVYVHIFILQIKMNRRQRKMTNSMVHSKI